MPSKDDDDERLLSLFALASLASSLTLSASINIPSSVDDFLGILRVSVGLMLE